MLLVVQIAVGEIVGLIEAVAVKVAEMFVAVVAGGWWWQWGYGIRDGDSGGNGG